MKILIIAQYNTFPFEGGNSRFTYIIDQLDSKNNDIEFITSIFRHGKKEKRNFDSSIVDGLNYKLTLLDEPGYDKNVSLKRLYSHKILSSNLKRYLNNLNYKPDVIYCAVPSLDVAKVAVNYANKNNIKFIIDIQDLWPEAFKMAINIPILSNILFYPMQKQANKIYSLADEVVAVSETYANRALKVNKNTSNGLSVFLGTDLKKFDEYKSENKVDFNDGIVRLAYIGTLGHSYDIKCAIDAINILNKEGINNIKFILMGSGPLKETFEAYAKEKNVDCEFTGKLDYPKMVGLLCSCDIALNPIVKGAAQSIINKVGDYAASGLPVVSTQECQEYIDLLVSYKAGISCECGNAEEFAKGIKKVVQDKKLREKFGKGNRRLAEEKFDREKTYNQIVDLIEGKH